MTAVFASGNIFSTSQVGVPENVVDDISERAPWETPLLMHTGLDSLPTPCLTTTFIWQDQDHKPAQTTLNGGIGSSTTAMTFTDAINWVALPA